MPENFSKLLLRFCTKFSKLLYFLAFLFFMDKWEAETKPFRMKIENAIRLIDERIEDLKKGKREWNESKISPEIGKIGTKLIDRTIERFQEIKYALS